MHKVFGSIEPTTTSASQVSDSLLRKKESDTWLAKMVKMALNSKYLILLSFRVYKKKTQN